MEITCSIDVVEKEKKLTPEEEEKAKKEAMVRAYLGEEKVELHMEFLKTLIFESDYYYRNDVIDEIVKRIMAYSAAEGIKRYAESGETEDIKVNIRFYNKEFKLSEVRQITISEDEWMNMRGFLGESPKFEKVSNSLHRMIFDFICRRKEKEAVTNKQ